MSFLKSAWKADNYKFTGKESLQGTGYTDFGARWYDNIVPHFITQDVLADKFRRHSPYSYSINNPIRFVDPTGMAVESIEGGVKFTGDDAKTVMAILNGQKKNIYIDITADTKEQSTTSKANYKNWATFAVSSFSLASDVISIFKDNTIRNMVIEAHGIMRTQGGSFLDTYIRPDENDINTKITLTSLKEFNNGGFNVTSSDKTQIMALQNIMSKVVNEGNCIMNICNTGVFANEFAQNFAKELSTLSGNRLNIYTPSGYALGRTNQYNPNQGATFIGGGLSESSSTTWNKITRGYITHIIKNIVLSDSNNPVEFK